MEAITRRMMELTLINNDSNTGKEEEIVNEKVKKIPYGNYLFI